MKNHLFTTLTTLAVGIAGCGTSMSYTELNTAPHGPAPKAADAVDMYTTAVPEKPYVEVGMIESQQQSGWSRDDDSAIIAKMRVLAGQKGCDGLVLNGANDKVVGSARGIATLKGFKGTCIVYKD